MAKGPWNQAAKVRNQLADMIEGLSDEQLDATTLSAPWNVRQVAGHALYIAEMKMGRFMRDMFKARFDYDKMNDTTARALAELPMDQLLKRLRAAAPNAAPAPGFVEMIPVGDFAIHTQDIRRPLGLAGSLDDDVLTTALDFVTTHKIGKDFSDAGEGVRFEATDLDWSFGDGPVASGPAESILMTLAGRVTGELTGDGAAGI